MLKMEEGSPVYNFLSPLVIFIPYDTNLFQPSDDFQKKKTGCKIPIRRGNTSQNGQTDPHLVGSEKKHGLGSVLLLNRKDGCLLGSKCLWLSYVCHTNLALM